MLLACLGSLREQIYRDFEVIVVDDGSSDGTESLAPHVEIYVRTPPMGVGHARNIAISLARGEFLYVLDSDDWLSPEALELSIATIDESGADMVFSDLHEVRNGSIVGRFQSRVQTAAEALQSKDIPHGSTMIRKSTLNVRYDEQLESAEDFDFLIRYLPGKKLARLPRAVYYRRLHTGQESEKDIQGISARQIRAKYLNT
jgi:glycosyltransferase involved in cell wall biosynthesis